MIICKGKDEIARMRRAGRVVAQALSLARKSLRPRLTTSDIDALIEKFIMENGAQPAFKGFHGYPASTCVSVNEEVVHGIPGRKKLNGGDIVGVDIGVNLDGYFADAAATFPVGRVTPAAEKLLRTTEACLRAGIERAVAGNHLSDISHAIQERAEADGYKVVREFVGHGIGRDLHEDPQIPNFGPPGRGPVLKEGMVLALEPMLNIGTAEVKVLGDNWTVVTKDKSLSAHFEHTVAVTSGGPQILTLIN